MCRRSCRSPQRPVINQFISRWTVVCAFAKGPRLCTAPEPTAGAKRGTRPARRATPRTFPRLNENAPLATPPSLLVLHPLRPSPLRVRDLHAPCVRYPRRRRPQGGRQVPRLYAGARGLWARRCERAPVGVCRQVPEQDGEAYVGHRVHESGARCEWDSLRLHNAVQL